jgi:hypothetical protein
VKVADLVKWLHPDALDFGLILKIGEAHFADQVFIEWHRKPEHSGYYPANHELLEVISSF